MYARGMTEDRRSKWHAQHFVKLLRHEDTIASFNLKNPKLLITQRDIVDCVERVGRAANGEPRQRDER